MNTIANISALGWINTLETFAETINDEELYENEFGHAGDQVQIYFPRNYTSELLPITFKVGLLNKGDDQWKKLSIISCTQISTQILDQNTLTIHYRTTDLNSYYPFYRNSNDCLSKAVEYLLTRAAYNPKLESQLKSIATNIKIAQLAVDSERQRTVASLARHRFFLLSQYPLPPIPGLNSITPSSLSSLYSFSPVRSQTQNQTNGSDSDNEDLYS